MLSLKSNYISVAYTSGPSFGGNQRFFDNNTVSGWGCGLIAATDLLIYLCRRNKVFPAVFCNLPQNGMLPEREYTAAVLKMRNYFPLIPYAGMNGLGLMAGMELFFRRKGLPYSCTWCISTNGIWNKIETMLIEDIPVIMAVGPNFPYIWKKGRTILHSKDNLGNYKPASSVKAHFVTVTGMDENWLVISSWGKKFYINRHAYEEYIKNSSSALVSNILYIRKK